VILAQPHPKVALRRHNQAQPGKIRPIERELSKLATAKGQ
jgi:hypothetical protein